MSDDPTLASRDDDWRDALGTTTALASDADQSDIDEASPADDLPFLPGPTVQEEPALPPPAEPPPIKAGPELESRLLIDRQDVLRAFYIEFYESGAYKAPEAWLAHFNEATPEAFARRWYDDHGRWEGYASPQEGVDLERLLHERPDVMKSYYEGFYETGFDRKPDAWVARVGGASLDDYAKYWFDRHGKWEGYSQSPTGERLSVEQLLHDRPDVLRAFYQEYYEQGAFKHAAEWNLRIGGATPEDYAKYWYDRHGKWEGYVQVQPEPEPEPEPEPIPEDEPPLDLEPQDPEPAPADDAGPPEELVVDLAGGSDPADLFV